MEIILSEIDITVYIEGDKSIWIPVSSRSPANEARAFIPFNGIDGSYTYGFKAAPKNGGYFDALRAIQDNWKKSTARSFAIKNGHETQRADKWRHGNVTGSPLLGPTAGWVKVPVLALGRVTAEELASKLERAGTKFVSSSRAKIDPEGPMFRAVSVQARTFQLAFRDGALELWGAKCALSGAICLLEAAHIKSVADCKINDQPALVDPLNSIIVNIALHALLDEGLIAFSDSGDLLVSSKLGPSDRAVYGVGEPLKASFNAKALKYVQHHRNKVFRT